MAIIGGRIGKKLDKNYTHRITIENDKGERTTQHFFTIRSARNYMREHPNMNIVELYDLKNARALDLNPASP